MPFFQQMKLRKITFDYFLKNPSLVEFGKNVFSSKLLFNNRLYQSYALKRARAFDRKRPDPFWQICIENAIDCNSRCIMCGHSKNKLHGFMPMDLFRKIIDDCFASGIRGVNLLGYGEPFVDPFLFDRIKYLRKYSMIYGLFTNGSLLDAIKAEKLLSLGGLVKVNFSVCGLRADVYEKIMSGLKRDKVYDNILSFLALKEKYNLKDLLVAISTVKLHLNTPELKDFIRFWKKQKGVNHIITANLWDRVAGKDVSGLGKLEQFHSRGLWLAPCRQLWGNFNVYYDGRVAPCCDDAANRELIIGDFKTQTLSQIRTSKEIKDLRRLHLENKRLEHPICGRCRHNYLWI